MADIYTLIDRDGTPVPVMVFRPSPLGGNGRAVRIILLPGANCMADCYRWLAGALSAEGMTVLMPDPPVRFHPSPADPKKKKEASYVTVDQMVKVLAMPWMDNPAGAVTIAVGHSLGGVVVMEYLDPAQAMADPRSGVGAGYAPPVSLDGGVIIGASLQAELMGMTIPWRTDDTSLHKPKDMPLLFLAGDADGISPPEQVAATVKRYAPPAITVVQAGATHFGWTDGEAAADIKAFDGMGSLAPGEQKNRTVAYITAFVRSLADDRADRTGRAVKDAVADGDTVIVC